MQAKALLLLLSLLLTACANTEITKPVASDYFQSGELAQSGANRIANLAMRDNLNSLQLLLEKLYKRNPKEAQKTAINNQQAIQLVMSAIRSNQPLPGLAQRSTDAVTIALQAEYQGDHAGALIYGLGTMLMDTYGGRTEQYLIHGLDAQQLANASHNLEVAAWLLAQRKNNMGQPILLSNELTPLARNLSFEREFGKMIARLDLLAELTDEKLRRSAIDFGQSLVAGPFLQFLPISAAAHLIAP